MADMEHMVGMIEKTVMVHDLDVVQMKNMEYHSDIEHKI